MILLAKTSLLPELFGFTSPTRFSDPDETVPPEPEAQKPHQVIERGVMIQLRAVTT